MHCYFYLTSMIYWCQTLLISALANTNHAHLKEFNVCLAIWHINLTHEYGLPLDLANQTGWRLHMIDVHAYDGWPVIVMWPLPDYTCGVCAGWTLSTGQMSSLIYLSILDKEQSRLLLVKPPPLLTQMFIPYELTLSFRSTVAIAR